MYVWEKLSCGGRGSNAYEKLSDFDIYFISFEIREGELLWMIWISKTPGSKKLRLRRNPGSKKPPEIRFSSFLARGQTRIPEILKAQVFQDFRPEAEQWI